MNDEDGHRIDAAMQYGFSEVEGAAVETYAATEEQLIMFAKACERAGYARAANLLRDAEKNAFGMTERSDMSDGEKTIMALTSGVFSSAAELIEQRRDEISGIVLPFLEAERVRSLTADGYVRDSATGEWVKPETATCTICSAEPSSGFYTGCMAKDGHAPEWNCDGRGNLTRKATHSCPCGVGEEPCPTPDGRPACDPAVSPDAKRLEFLDTWSKRSRTGVSIEWTQEEGYRVMTFHKIDAGQPDIRKAIDAAIALRNAESA